MTSAASKATTTTEVAAQPLDPNAITANDCAAAPATEPAADR